MARFLIDEDCPRSLAPALRQEGHEVEDIRDIGLRGASDDDVIERARPESRCLITCDTGLGNIIRYPPSKYAGILVIRLPDTIPAKSRVARTVDAIRQLSGQSLNGSLVILEPGRIRVRR